MAEWKCTQVYCLKKTATVVGLRQRLRWLEWILGKTRPTNLPVTFVARSTVTSNYRMFVELKILS